MADERFKKAVQTSQEIELTVTGRTSGRQISIPATVTTWRRPL